MTCFISFAIVRIYFARRILDAGSIIGYAMDINCEASAKNRTFTL